MMKLGLIGACLAAAASHCAAQTDLAKLRAAIVLPQMSLQFQMQYTPPADEMVSPAIANETNPSARIAILQKSLKGDLSDASIYVLIGETYSGATDLPNASTKQTEAYAHAVPLFRKQLEMRPGDGWVMAQLGTALWGSLNYDEGEKWLRDAVKTLPNDWRCWARLGEWLQSTSLVKLLNHGKPGVASLADFTEWKHVLEPMVRTQGFDKAVATLIAVQKEAQDAFNKAVMLAPAQSGPYYRRAMCNYMDHLYTQNVLRIARGEPVDFSTLITDATMADWWKAADFSPDDAKLQSQAVTYELISHAAQLANDKSADKRAGLDKLPADSKAKITRAVARLTKSAADGDRATAELSLLSLTTVNILIGDYDEATKMAVRAFALDPENPLAFKAVGGCYAQSERYADLAQVLQDQLKRQDSATARIMLAKAYAKLSKHAEELEQITTGLSKFQDDLLLNLALTDELMKNTDADSLKKAGEQISIVQKIFDKLPESEKQANQSNFDIARGIYLALIGKPEVAKAALQRVLMNDPDNEEAKEALSTLGAQ